MSEANQEACRGGFITVHRTSTGYHDGCTELCKTVKCNREGCGHPTTEKPEEWEQDLLRKFFVYRMAEPPNKFPDHVGAQNDLVEHVRSLIHDAELRGAERVERAVEVASDEILRTVAGPAATAAHMIVAAHSAAEDEKGE